MIIRTKEIAKVYYDVEYYIDDSKIPEEIKEKLIKLKETNEEEYDNLILDIIDKYTIDESAEQYPDAFDFKIVSIEK